MRAVTSDYQVDPVGEVVAQDAAKKLANAEDARRVQFLVGMMRTAEGRQFVWDLIRDGGFFGTGERVSALAQWDTHRVAHAIGVRHFAGLMWQRLEDGCPELLAAMVTEAMTRLRLEKETKQ
jgi:hypothetical protein